MNDQSGHRPVFKLAPAEADITTLILGARDEVVNDPNLSLGARLMFTIILDRSVRQSTNIKPGVVTVSQTKLAEVLGVGRRSIWNWKDELVRRGVIWMTSQPMPNAWPIDTYHVTALHAPARRDEKTTVEGAWGNGQRQVRPANASFFARRNVVPLAPDFQTPEKSSILPNNAAPRGKVVPPSGEIWCHGPGKSGATGRGTVVPRAVERSFSGPGKSGATASGTVVPRPVESEFPLKKAKVPGFRAIEGGTTPPDQHDEAFKRWESRLDDMRNSDLRKQEEIATKEFQAAKSIPARELGKRKLVAIRSRLLGPAVADVEKKTATVRTTTPKPTPMPLDQRRKLLSKHLKEVGLK